MFEQSFIAEGRTRRERKIALVLLLQGVAVTGLALLPLLSTESIEAGTHFLLLSPAHITPDKPLAKKPEVTQASPRTSGPTLRVVQLATLGRRFSAPTHIAALEPGDAPPLAFGGTSAGDASGTLLNSLGTGDGGIAPPQAIPAAPKTPRGPVRLPSRISLSQLTFGPKPVYPKLALSARTEGTVRLLATISRDGRIENLHVLSGPAMLTAAAMDAVSQWRYRPVFLNGDAVEVITEIDVNFTLANK